MPPTTTCIHSTAGNRRRTTGPSPALAPLADQTKGERGPRVLRGAFVIVGRETENDTQHTQSTGGDMRARLRRMQRGEDAPLAPVEHNSRAALVGRVMGAVIEGAGLATIARREHM